MGNEQSSFKNKAISPKKSGYAANANSKLPEMNSLHAQGKNPFAIARTYDLSQSKKSPLAQKKEITEGLRSLEEKMDVTEKELDQHLSHDKVIQITPYDHEAHYNKGISLHDLGKYQDAIASYDKAIQLKPDYHEAQSKKGNSLAALGKYQDAIASYDKAIQIKPDYHIAHSNKGISLDDLGKYQDAIVSYDKAIQIKPDFVDAHTNKGNCLKAIGKYQDAIASYDKAIQIKPDFDLAHNNKGAILHALGKYQDAIVCFDKAIQIDPDDALYYCNLANTLSKLNKPSEALEKFKIAKLLLDTKEQKTLSPGNLTYIKNALAEISELEALVQKVEANLKKLDPNNSITKTLLSQFTEIQDANRTAISHINFEESSNKKFEQSTKKLEERQKEMEAFNAYVLEKLKEEVLYIKEQQQHHSKQHDQHNKRLDQHEQKLFELAAQTNLLIDLNAKGQATLDMIKSTLFTNIKLQAEHQQEVDAKLSIITSEVVKGKAKSDLVQHMLKDINEIVTEHGTRLDHIEQKQFNLENQTELLIDLIAKGQSTVDMIKSTLFTNIKLQGEYQQEVDVKLSIITSEVAKGKAKSDLVQHMLKDINEIVKGHGTRESQDEQQY